MVRPDRAEPAASPAVAARGREPEDGRRARRARRPLIIAGIVLLLGAAGWALLASQGPSSAARDDASAHRSTATASAHASADRSSARPTASLTPTPKHSSAPTAAEVASSARTSVNAAPTASNTSSSGSLLSLPGVYYRFKNAQSGDCLAGSGGAAAQSACASSRAEGWEYSDSLSGLLTAVSGEFELVNEQSGDCLTAESGGQVGAQACDGDSAQLWTQPAGAGASGELHNTGDGQCLRGARSAVGVGACSTADQAELWSENGTA
jgi:hypothetical protein